MATTAAVIFTALICYRILIHAKDVVRGKALRSAALRTVASTGGKASAELMGEAAKALGFQYPGTAAYWIVSIA